MQLQHYVSQPTICRMLHPISMKIFEGHLVRKWSTEKKIDDIIGHVIWQPYCLRKKINKPSKISEVAEHIEAKRYTYDHLSMRNKRFTHMASLVTWFDSHIGFTLKTYKKSSSPERLDRSRRNFTQMFPKPWVYKFVQG